MDKKIIAEFVGSHGDCLSHDYKNKLFEHIVGWEEYRQKSPVALPLHREQGEEEVQPWQQVISDRINYFSTHHHKFESKELHDALNVILRLVPPALWQAASQEKGVRWVKASERLPKVLPEDETSTRFIVDDRNEEGYGKVWLMTYHDLKDLAHYEKNIKWLDESTAPDTVQGQEELWADITEAFGEEIIDIQYIKDHYTLTKK